MATDIIVPPLSQTMDSVILVADTPERASARLQARDGIGSDTVSSRWARQWPIERKRILADHVIENSGTLEELNDSARRLYISLTGNPEI